MTEQEAIRNLCTIMWNVKGYSADVLREALTVAIHALERQTKYRWHNLVDNPSDTPDKYNCDWVLAQIVEDNGYVWVPKVAEYRASKQDWLYREYWLSDYGGGFKVVAWCELPTNDWSDSNE